MCLFGIYYVYNYGARLIIDEIDGYYFLFLVDVGKKTSSLVSETMMLIYTYTIHTYHYLYIYCIVLYQMLCCFGKQCRGFQTIIFASFLAYFFESHSSLYHFIGWWYFIVITLLFCTNFFFFSIHFLCYFDRTFFYSLWLSVSVRVFYFHVIISLFLPKLCTLHNTFAVKIVTVQLAAAVCVCVCLSCFLLAVAVVVHCCSNLLSTASRATTKSPIEIPSFSQTDRQTEIV